MTPGTEAHFLSHFDPSRAEVLYDVLVTASREASAVCASQNYAMSLTNRQIAFNAATRDLEGRFDALPGIELVKSGNQILWVIDGIYGVRVKALGPGYRPRNHKSQQQSRISGQLQLDGLDQFVYLTAGTRYSTRTGLPIEYVVVKHYPGITGRLKAEWVVDLNDAASGQLVAATTPLFPTAGTSTPPAVVRSRGRRRKQSEGEGQ